MSLVLSLFPGIGLLDYAFECEGFTVVRGPDVLWGGDIRRFHPPADRFDGIIGGDPCQSHSSLANLVRAKGHEPSFPDMTGEYQRVVEEAQPAWFLRENVPKAPDIKPAGYDVRSFMLCNSTLDSGDGTGNEQMRRRRFWFGTRDRECQELRQWIDFALYELPDAVGPVSSVTNLNDKDTPFALRRRHAAVASDGRFGHRVNDGTGGTEEGNFRARQAPVTGRHEGAIGVHLGKDYSPPRRNLEEMIRLQGLPPGWIGHQPWTVQAMRKMIGNGVAVPTGRALAKSIRCAVESN